MVSLEEWIGEISNVKVRDFPFSDEDKYFSNESVEERRTEPRMSVLFTRDYLENELGLPYENDNVLIDEEMYHGRWSISRRIVFQAEGKYFETFYNVPNTEFQECERWDYDDYENHQIECWEVFPKEKTTIEWVRAE